MHIARSYHFDQFEDDDRRSELERLHRQATVLIDKEIGVLSKLGLARGRDFVEIGCGPGFVTGVLADLVAPAKAVGVDVSAELLAAARKVMGPHHANLELVEGNAYELPLPSESFDFAYCRLLYQHLSEPSRALHQARRVLRKGGRLVIMDVDDDWLTLHPPSNAFERIKVLAAQHQRIHGGDRMIGRKLAGLMHNAGFVDVRLHVEAVSTLDLPIRDFLAITTRFKSVQIGKEESGDLMAALDAEVEAMAQPFGVVGAFFVSGQA